MEDHYHQASTRCTIPSPHEPHPPTDPAFGCPGPLPSKALTLTPSRAGAATFAAASATGIANVSPASACSSSVTVEFTAITCR